jgi:GNAT superfamily N-acetyltransferase
MIRAATPDDFEAIAALAGELGYPSTAEQIRARFAQLAPDANAILVADDGHVTGWIHIAMRFSIEVDPGAQICGLVVAETHRGRGIGAKLVAAAEQWARERNMPRVRVQSNVIRERTHLFYERNGYESRKRQVVFEKRLS